MLNPSKIWWVWSTPLKEKLDGRCGWELPNKRRKPGKVGGHYRKWEDPAGNGRSLQGVGGPCREWEVPEGSRRTLQEVGGPCRKWEDPAGDGRTLKIRPQGNKWKPRTKVCPGFCMWKQIQAEEHEKCHLTKRHLTHVTSTKLPQLSLFKGCSLLQWGLMLRGYLQFCQFTLQAGAAPLLLTGKVRRHPGFAVLQVLLKKPPLCVIPGRNLNATWLSMGKE